MVCAVLYGQGDRGTEEPRALQGVAARAGMKAQIADIQAGMCWLRPRTRLWEYACVSRPRRCSEAHQQSGPARHIQGPSGGKEIPGPQRQTALIFCSVGGRWAAGVYRASPSFSHRPWTHRHQDWVCSSCVLVPSSATGSLEVPGQVPSLLVPHFTI